MLCTRNGKRRVKSQIIAWFDKAVNVGLLLSSIQKSLPMRIANVQLIQWCEK